MTGNVWLDTIDAIIKGLLPPSVGMGLVFALFFGPFLVLCYFAHRRRQRYRAEAEAPFTRLPMRPPGESLRLKIETLGEKLDECLLILLFGSAVAACLVAFSPEKQRTVLLISAVLMLAVLYVRTGRTLFTTQRQLWNHRLGFMGERVVGEALNQLLADGYRVFHDLPFEDFNIDHVVAGSAGVYAVETKTRGKPLDMPGNVRAKVTFDGEWLIYPKNRTRDALDQVERNAKTLAQWLTSATGEFTEVKAMLVLPGWFVECKAVGKVTVLNEKMARSFFQKRVAAPLSGAQIQRIAHQLAERCRLSEDPVSAISRSGVQFATGPAIE